MKSKVNIVKKARIFATAAHGAVGQKRKYTGEPYINHPREVVKLLESVGHTNQFMIAAAWLHDVVEDTDISLADIELEFGSVITSMVSGLTDVSKLEDGNRAERKKIDREHLARQSKMVQTIKCADLISNTASIVEHDPEFAKVYLEEAKQLLAVMHEADDDLWQIAWEQVTVDNDA